MSTITHKISIIVAVKNEEKYIGKCLESLLNQTISKNLIKIIVVDGKSTDKTRKIVNRYIQKYPKLIKLINNPDEWQSSGRNIAIKNETKSELIAYIDGHCFADKNWLKSLYETLNDCKDSKVAGVGSTHISPKEENIFGKAVEQVFNSLIGGMGSSYRQAKQKKVVNTAPFVLYKRKALESVNFYDEEMKYGEDYSLNFKLRKKGYKILVEPKAIVYYYKKKTFRSFLRQMYNYGTAKAIIGKKYPGAISIIHILPLFLFSAFIIFGLLGLYYYQLRILFILGIIFYIIGVLSFSFISALKKRIFALVGLMPILYLIEHIAYSIGFFTGFFKRGWVK